MSLIDDILDNHDKMLESADRVNASISAEEDDDAGCCWRCNCQWSVPEICNTCEQCPDCCECEK